MRKKIVLILFVFFGAVNVNAAVRDENAISRTKSTNITNQVQSRSAVKNTVNRSAKNSSVINRNSSNVSERNITSDNKNLNANRSATIQKRNIPTKTVTARAATGESSLSETKTGAAYEQCKTAYFTCMDQFCALKNDSFRRCSCSDRIYDLEKTQNTLQDANEQITAFNEGIDSVSLTAEQATSMKTSSDGEDALTKDSSASKALLQAIMNSIKGEDSKVSGKYEDLNSINLSFDTTNAFGMVDKGQAIAAYNGTDLYNAIFSQCRNAVKADCNDASLQRAVTAYLMSIEQDCNTVETSINATQKKMKSAVRESGAMLDLARVENRQNHNSDDMATCLANVESAVLSEEVCGANYHKCLDNGEFIDLTTGSPIEGVANFYELGKLLSFDASEDVSDQKLSKISHNKPFVVNFENRVKKFADPALDKCVDNADQVWEDYLNKAMLQIYYSQQSKVDEIKQGCFDLITACYTDGQDSITKAMSELTGDSETMLQAYKISLNSAICNDYIQSCSNMFDKAVIADYIEKITDTDTLTACRAVVQDCFTDFGSTSYENFYYPSSGSFDRGNALEWFTLCGDADCTPENYVSECAKELYKVDACSSDTMMKKVFGGFDYKDGDTVSEYGLYDSTDTTDTIPTNIGFAEYDIRSTGVATEVYNQVIDILSTQCENLLGRFVQPQFLKSKMYGTLNNTEIAANNVTPDDTSDDTKYSICQATFNNIAVAAVGLTPEIKGDYNGLVSLYGVGRGEDMCPEGYENDVDISSWGACLCWENGARRSLNGTSAKCVAQIPVLALTSSTDTSCKNTLYINNTPLTSTTKWCTQSKISDNNQACPLPTTGINSGECYWNIDYPEQTISKIPKGIE